MTKDGIANNQELVHAGNDGDLVWLASELEAFEECFEEGVVTSGGGGGHV